MIDVLDIHPPFPGRQAVQRLREQVVRSLVAKRPPVGSKLVTDAELAQRSGLSLATVGRALRELSREGWIERRMAHGSFVGPRVAMSGSFTRPEIARGRKLVRVAVLVMALGDMAHDPVTPLLLGGIDDVAAKEGLSVELIGERNADVPQLSRRLQQSRPDVLVTLAPGGSRWFLLGEAHRLGIPVVIAGPQFELGLPQVYEDSTEGVAAAIERLVDRGHRRISYVETENLGWWQHLRRRGYLAGLRRAGIEVDQNRLLTLDMTTTQHWRSCIVEHLQHSESTAVVCETGHTALQVKAAAQGLGWDIPQRLSVLAVDQTGQSGWGEQRLTHVALPFRQMGEESGRLARQIAEGREAPQRTVLPCQWIEGETIMSFNENM